jgi:hypothetical protein
MDMNRVECLIQRTSVALFEKSIGFGSTDELKESQKDVHVRVDVRWYGTTLRSTQPLLADQSKRPKREIPTSYMATASTCPVGIEN